MSPKCFTVEDPELSGLALYIDIEAYHNSPQGISIHKSPQRKHSVLEAPQILVLPCA